MFYIGCPIWGYKGWVGNFFPSSTPQSNFLQVYSRKLTTVEGNTTFTEFTHRESMELHGLPSTLNSAELSQGNFLKESCSGRFTRRESNHNICRKTQENGV